ncbi:MAG TPA: FAD-dependent oxidoreductase [Opitutaceae bacterium]|nr:FAD-dependent oxidoreductase [Opitutaceae bacterium]
MRFPVLFLVLPTLALADGLSSPNPGLRHFYELPPAQSPQTLSVDVCVYGGSPAGVGAAIQARRLGKTAALAVFRRHVGGLTSAGLTAVDLGKKESIGGLAAEFLNRMGQWSNFRSGDAESTFRAMLDEAEVPVYYEHRLARVEKRGRRIVALEFENGNRIEARMFIDATYEGDLLAMAGVTFVVGRESNSDYGETYNGYHMAPAHQFRFPVDPYRTPGDPKSGLLPGISPEPPRPDGSGDKWVQAYNFRMWLTTAEAGLPFPKPAGYDRDTYALLQRYLTTAPAGFEWDWTYRHGPIRLQLGDCNNAGPFSTDFIGGSNEWPEADYPTREKIFQAHVTYQQGLVWFLANDEEVPEKIRTHIKKFGLPRDQFVETNGWPHELYVREGRRMVSDYVMTEHECKGRRVAPDSVCLASYGMDSHHTSRVVVDGKVRAEGDAQYGVPAPYPVSYRSLVPREEECENLLVGVCVSSTHIAYGSIRMEPVFMMLGQSAATAASLAIDNGVTVQRVDYPTLREQLQRAGQILDWQQPAKP